jgi:uncharacterized protein with HEPN domain
MPSVLRDPRLLLEDIRDSCEKVARYSTGLSRDAVLSNEMSLDATKKDVPELYDRVAGILAELPLPEKQNSAPPDV